MRAHRYAILPALAVTLLVGSNVPARAQVRVPTWGAHDVRGAAYENGYQRGYREGERDVRSRRPAEFRRDGEYRDADWGYERRYGSRDDYRRVFRNGFEAGYSDGYRGRGVAYGRRPLPPAPGYPDRRDDRYGVWGNGGYGSHGNASSQVAFNYGYNDGYERGVKAAHDRKPFDPNREGWYRDGDRHYDRDYGPRDQYKVTYRNGFVNGYEEGYRGRGYTRR